MKKRIVGALLVLGLSCFLVNCSGGEVQSTVEGKEKYKVSDFIELERIASDVSEEVFVDRNTGNLYYMRGGYSYSSLTVIYNADGTIKNIKEYEDAE